MNLWRRFNPFKSSTSHPPTGIKFDRASRTLECQVAFLGNPQTGRTHLIWACSRKHPWVEYHEVPARETRSVDVNVVYGSTELVAWDLAVHESFSLIRLLIYRETGILAFVFSIDDPESLQNIENKWREEVDHFCPGIPWIVIGCKADLRDKSNNAESVLAETQAGIELAKRLGARQYVECSAQKYINIEELSTCLANIAWVVYKQHKANPSALLDHEFETVLMPGDKDSPVVL
ncbi:P-loop containing nucleoside triphosphate hydrolase protein [Ceratobasidium sp. AG-I]|nr:P-loop containing nucleoside triphosphate hydrolase protein [Ceratobasidium sp. AG-I]